MEFAQLLAQHSAQITLLLDGGLIIWVLYAFRKTFPPELIPSNLHVNDLLGENYFLRALDTNNARPATNTIVHSTMYAVMNE